MNAARGLEYEKGVVVEASVRGVKLQGDERLRNWTNFVDEHKRPIPDVGSTVRVGQDGKKFVREITDKDGNPLQPAGQATGSTGAAVVQAAGKWTEEEQWRALLATCLGQAVSFLDSAGFPEIKPAPDKEPIAKSDVAYALAKKWAKRIWLEPLPAVNVQSQP